MTQTPRQRAEHAQSRASDPAASAWVEASAGSGKTKLLTDRVLRLLLAGVEPGRILCLTFTKAAAAQMATRLAKALGGWATDEDGKLAATLATLTGRAPGEDELRAARALFVRVLEQPGGMRISTIHAFAQSLLRAFPLEAGLAPQFAVVEDQEARAMLAREREAVLAGAPDRAALAHLARLVPPDRFAEVLGTLAQSRGRLLKAVDSRQGLAGFEAALAHTLGLRVGQATEDAVLRAACALEEAPLIAAARALGRSGNEKTDQRNAAAMIAWLTADQDARIARWDEWRRIFVTGDNTVRKTLVTGDKRIAGDYATILAAMQDEGERIVGVENARAATRVLAATMALLAIGTPVLKRYEAAKNRAGMLDYDDLIAGAQRLLEDPGSAWVLFKLDGGLDHVLLDEAQDSNPDQWGIVRALTGEFFAGEGAREQGRTIFAVGDVKQSIYGFQGADAEGFSRERTHYGAVVPQAGLDFRPVPLDVSFRSTAPVLALVDAVFAEGAAREGVVEPGATLRHYADRAGQAGSVELWPLLQVAEAEAPPAWAPPDAPVDGEGAAQRLATLIAARIRHMLDHETLPARVEKGREAEQPNGRPVRPGDILVLVRTRARGGFVASLVRALKDLRIPVGGVDRMVLAEQVAVQDLLALADVLLLPDDDLSLAALLKSPLVGLSEEELYDLAQPRTASLWMALAAHRGAESRLGRVAGWITALLGRADLATPHALFAAVLGGPGPLDSRAGRARMLARLGPDAADPMDEFLAAALEHERSHPPSLQGFVHRLRGGGAEVKREAEGAGNAVRIMTVHGAKGLQAPIVILPDTTGAPPDRATLRWIEDDLPAWAPKQEGFAAPALATRRQQDRDNEAKEQHRLLYVALTRAEDRLVVCGWQGKKEVPPGCWYRLVEQGFARLDGAAESPFDGPHDPFPAEATMRRLDGAQAAAPKAEDPPRAPAAAAALPEWARRPAPPEAPEGAVAPSALPGEEETPAAPPRPSDDPRGLRFRRGRLVHALLQHLPDHPPGHRDDVARRFLARPGHGLDAGEQAAVLEEVAALLREPLVAAALGPGSLAEAPLAGRVGGRLIAGQVDRLLVEPDRVLVLDYKTNRPPPTDLAKVAPLYLRQMAAYRALLRAAFPGRRVDCALVWTYGARVMALPDAVLDPHAPQA
ncbi:double-strand break repair helicase AddA [Roseomonas eburnea]|uniref:DNA 3'-5' helicase n=1 Tax=Neoroseomonas eburnea TaxID=1346889 RepID=A0A9X9XBY1_9PROT|nr:double-strand break repair helicase AddA [Neoroseomonas eburnea]MBR0681217.1 double-strand break repair helicase AddA [Neoroseomonas eburnea]